MRILAIAFALLMFLPESATSKPPDWAPAHGARAKHRYHYYPGAQIYFDLDRKVYFNLVGGSWQMTAVLPVGIFLGASISMTLDTPQPFTLHTQHVKAYPPAKYKKGGGKKKK